MRCCLRAVAEAGSLAGDSASFWVGLPGLVAPSVAARREPGHGGDALEGNVSYYEPGQVDSDFRA
jgi:hypothetical protein